MNNRSDASVSHAYRAYTVWTAIACAVASILAFGSTPSLSRPVHAASAHRIADAWYAHNALVVMLGGANQIVATVVRPAAFPWMYRVAPELRHAESIDGTTMNAEELQRLNADLVFTSKSDPSAPALERDGFKVVPVGFEDFRTLQDCVDQTAAIIGTPLARERAKVYRQYVTRTVADVTRVTSKIPLQKRPRVLHILSLDPLMVDGSDTIIDEWIRMAGGRNAAVGLKGVKKAVSVEQLLVWQPDIIILAAKAGTIEGSHQGDLLKSLSAVQHHQVYSNPAGVFPWDRYGPEVVLQLRWAAKVFHTAPESEDTLIKQVQEFYKIFFSYDLSDSEAQNIVKGIQPS